MIAAINEKDLRRFLYRIGFARAMSWSEDKLREFAMETGKKFPETAVPDEFQDLYETLKKYAKTGTYIEWAPPQRKKNADVSVE